MDATRANSSDETIFEESEEKIEPTELRENELRSVYLLTYSQANLDKYPMRADFGNAVVRAFSQGSAIVQH